MLGLATFREGLGTRLAYFGSVYWIPLLAAAFQKALKVIFHFDVSAAAEVSLISCVLFSLLVLVLLALSLPFLSLSCQSSSGFPHS